MVEGLYDGVWFEKKLQEREIINGSQQMLSWLTRVKVDNL